MLSQSRFHTYLAPNSLHPQPSMLMVNLFVDWNGSLCNSFGFVHRGVGHAGDIPLTDSGSANPAASV